METFDEALAAASGIRPIRAPLAHKPGVYPDLAMSDYLALKALSASVLSTLVNECPKAAWFTSFLNPGRERDSTDASDAGEIAHALLLEGSIERIAVIDPGDYPAKTTGSIPTGWTNVGIRAARDEARDAGKIPMLPVDVAAVTAMVDSAHEYIQSLRTTEPAVWAAFQPDGGDSELSCLWDDHGTLCRMRPDRISKDRKIIIDPKFTKRSAEPDGFARAQMTPMGYRLRAAWYRRGARLLFGAEPEYLFLVVEQDPPHLCSLVGVDGMNFGMGAEQVEYALREWNHCTERGYWPGYPARVMYPELAAWEVARWQEKQGIGPDGIPYDLDQLFKRKGADGWRGDKREGA